MNLKMILARSQTLNQVRRRYLGIAVLIFIGFSVILMLLFAYHLREINKINAESTRNQILEIKKEFLHDTVNNTIDYIEEMKSLNESRFIGRILRLKIYLEDHRGKFDIDHVQEYLESDFVNENLIIFIYKDGQIKYNSPSAEGQNPEEFNIGKGLGDCFIIEEVEYEGHTIFIGALNKNVKATVEETLRSRIYNDIYFQDSYLWVNEVINFSGGEGYALRLIHPNLKETEGTILSTDMEDIAGGRPYLEELEGIKKDGEIFFTYYFKKLDSEEIAEKLSYSKLYEGYDWIIAMGVYYDSLEEYFTAAEKSSEAQRVFALKILILIAAAMLFTGTGVFLYSERKYFSSSTQTLRTVIDTDPLTGSGSRRAGMDRLSAEFRRFKENGGVGLYNLLLLDLDDFKYINDTYGHDMGDRVLIRVVERIKSVIREGDGIYRWGGEEFIVFAKGIMPENLDTFISKLLAAVEGSGCSKDGEKIKTTVSIGATIFSKTDDSYDKAIKRSDDALYESKRTGKNKGTVFIDSEKIPD